ncbi:MAG: manganese catalase family protein, partial [Oscillospiraceae bacterium]
MWNYCKRLQYPVKIARPNAAAAKIILEQFGGPDGELGAANRYLAQRYSAPYDETKA